MNVFPSVFQICMKRLWFLYVSIYSLRILYSMFSSHSFPSLSSLFFFSLKKMTGKEITKSMESGLCWQNIPEHEACVGVCLMSLMSLRSRKLISVSQQLSTGNSFLATVGLDTYFDFSMLKMWVLRNNDLLLLGFTFS